MLPQIETGKTGTLLFRLLSDERARLRLDGPDARRFLHGMVSNDIQGLQAGQGCHAALLTIKGKLLGDLVIYACGDAGLLIELQANARASVYTALDRHLIMDKAAIHDESPTLAELGVYGDGAAAALATAAGFIDAFALAHLPTYHCALGPQSGLPTLIAATRELGMPGFHFIAPAAAVEKMRAQLLAQGGSELSTADAETLRIESGTPYYGQDIDEDRMPAEAGLDDAVSFTKGCYLGQEVVVRLRDRGHLNRRLCGLRLSDGGLPPAAGTRLRHPEKPAAGVITSAAVSPRFGTIALGYVHRIAWEPGTEVELIGPDDQPLGRTAQVVSLPFAPQPTRSAE